MTDWKIFTAEAMFWLNHAVWLYLAWVLWSYRRKRNLASALVRQFLAAAFLWMRFIEPNWITRNDTAIAIGAKARIVLISDLHLGAYKDAGFVERVVERINAEQADCVLIAGDFLYAARLPLDPLFAPLKKIKRPLYAVLGNHDRNELGPQYSEGEEIVLVDQSLQRAGVRLIENQIVDCGGVVVAGIGDRWSGREDARMARAYRGTRPLIALTHNPDHTHGGQIRVPWLYKKVLPVSGPYDAGLHAPATPGGAQVFVTTGLGETALPMRLFNPPVIDLITLN
jgi:uncharacterized protein